jgi:hypothetical protein
LAFTSRGSRELSSLTENPAAIEVFLTMAIQTLPSGGITVRNAWGSTTSRSVWANVRPIAREASAWPGDTALMPDRTASATNAAV